MARVKIGNVWDIDGLSKHFAPAGYGLGEDIKQYISMEDLDRTFVNGLYWVTCLGSMVDGQVYNYALARVSGNSTTHSIQELFPLGLDKVLIRRCYEGVWADEWDQLAWKSDVAPAGYGLGELGASKTTSIASEVDSFKRTGWFNYYNADNVDLIENAPNSHGCAIYTEMQGWNYGRQEAWTLDGGHLTRNYLASVWKPWEWINPPMLIGVEYRTTERWQGKAVYTKAIQCGNLPNASAVIVAHGCAAIAVIRCCGVTNLGTTIPYRWNDSYLDVSADRTNIHLCTNADFSGQTCIVQLWYTKD